MFVASEPVFGVMSQGKSAEGARRAVQDAVCSFIKVAHENKLLGKCLSG